MKPTRNKSEKILELISFSEESTKKIGTLKEKHDCELCTQFPFVSDDIFELEKHLEIHSVTLSEYFNMNDISGIHNIEEYDDIVISECVFIREKPKIEEKPKEFLKINGEIVRTKKIGGTFSFERMDRVIKRTKDGRKISWGGLRKNVKQYIPKVEDSFILNESFHTETIRILSSYGFKCALLTGDTGLGKTDSVRQICARMNQPVVTLKITGDTHVKHIFQDENYDPQLKKLVKVDKGIIKALEMGAVLLVDEISAANPSVNFIFYELLENGYIVDYDGIKREPHPMFKVIFTDNRIGNPNYYRYHGTQEQSLAFKNRIQATIIYGYMKNSIERKILEMKYPECDSDFIDKLFELTKIFREENKKGNFQETFPIRTMQNICSNYEIFRDPEKAFKLGYMNNITDQGDKDFVGGICQRIFGQGKFRD